MPVAPNKHILWNCGTPCADNVDSCNASIMPHPSGAPDNSLNHFSCWSRFAKISPEGRLALPAAGTGACGTAPCPPTAPQPAAARTGLHPLSRRSPAARPPAGPPASPPLLTEFSPANSTRACPVPPRRGTWQRILLVNNFKL